jgi:hypothetical protein
MPEDEKDPFKEFGGSEKKTEQKDPFAEFGGTQVDLKKKEPSTQSPSLLVAGTQGSATGESAPSGIDYMKGDVGQFVAPTQPEPLKIPQQQQEPLRAATTPAETTAKDQTQFSAEAQKTLTPGPLYTGLAKAGSILLQSPTFVYDAAATITNKLINEPFGIPNAPMFSQIGNVDESVYKSTIEDLEAGVKQAQESRAQKYDKEINEYLFGEKKDINKGLSLLADNVLESLPTSMGLMLATAVNPAAAFAGGISGFAADKKRELDKAVPDMPEEQKVLWAAASGSIEQGFESMGLSKLGLMLKATFKKMGKEAAEAEAKEAFKQTYGKVLKKYMGVHAEEVLTEMGNTFTQNAIDLASGVDPERKLMDGVWDSGLVAFASSGGMTTPAAALDLAVTKQARQKAQELQAQKTAIQNDLQSPTVNADAKPALSNKLKDINEEEANIAEEQKALMAGLSEEGKKQVQDVLNKSNQIASAIVDPTVSEETKEALKKDLEANDSKIEKIIEDAKAQPKPEETQKKPESEASKAQATPASEAQGPEENTQGQAPVTEIEMPPRIKGGQPQVYKKDTDGVWKQKVGNELSEVSPKLQEELQLKADEMGSATVKGVDKPYITESLKTKTVKPSSPEEIKGIPLKDIFIAPTVREKVGSQLSKGVKSKQGNAPISLLYKSDGTLEVLDGAHRFLEAEKRGDEEIDATVFNVEQEYEEFVPAKKDTDTSKKPESQSYKEKRANIDESKKYTDTKDLEIGDLAGITTKEGGTYVGLVTKKGTKNVTIQTQSETYGEQEIQLKTEDVRAFYKPKKGVPVESKKEESVSEQKQEAPPPEEPPSEPPTPPSKPDGLMGEELAGEEKKRKTFVRMEANEKTYKGVLESVDEQEKFYPSLEIAEVKKATDSMVDKLEQEGMLEQSANDIIAGKELFYAPIKNVMAAKIGERLRLIAEREGNEMQKSHYLALAAKLWTIRNKSTTVSAQQTAMEAIVAETMPLSEAGLMEYAKQSFASLQQQQMTPAQQAQVKTVFENLQELLATEEGQAEIRKAVDAEVNRIAEETKGKDWVANVDNVIDSLKIDISAC